MKEFINKLIGRLEELKTYYAEDFSQGYSCEVDCVEKYEVKKIVNELAEEYKLLENIEQLNNGWIEKLLEAKENCSEDSYCSECPLGQIEDRCILAELQIKGGNNGWIPCSERLPKKSGKYLITQERYSLEDRLCKRPIAIEVDYVVFNATDNLWARASFFKVIAWQPLPAPYKEGVTENELS